MKKGKGNLKKVNNGIPDPDFQVTLKWSKGKIKKIFRDLKRIINL